MAEKGAKNAPIELDASKSDKKIWLVKVPNFVAQKWHAACESSANGSNALGQELGTVKIEMDQATVYSPDKVKIVPLQAKTSCTLELAGDIKDVPREYKMRQATGDASCIYSFGQEPGLICVNGKVQQRFDVEMRHSQAGQAAQELDPSYRKLSRERNTLAATKTRTAQIIDPQNAARVQQQGRAYAGIASKRRLPGNSRERKIADKRVRMDKEPLENLLFRLFERQDFWSFQNLVKECDQPVAWLKEVLLEIAVQNKAPGLNKDLWQLKSEYRMRT